MKTTDMKHAHPPEGLTETVGERAKGYVDVGVSALNAVSGKARRIGQSADGYVRDNAWLAIGAATGVGILIGFMLRGRRES